MALSNGTRLGPYEIVAPLGAGGMGDVYRATDTRLHRTVAIKIVKSQFAERFEREGRAISALNHPNICTLHDVGSQDGISYLVMECVDGKPVQGPLPVDEALRFAIQIAAALEAAHQRGIVHRDLKPANILLTKSGVKLLDFGLAKFAQATPITEVTVTTPLTSEGQILGTLQYMAPEQLEGKVADERSDIFAFGLVLYEMLTGQRAFRATSQASLIAAILKEEPQPVPQLQLPANAALDRTLKKCLAKDPARRWQTVTDLRDELTWIAGHGGVVSPAISRRSLLPWIGGAALVGAGSAGLAAWALRGRGGIQGPLRGARAIRLRMPIPEGLLTNPSIVRQSFAVSPVGGRIAMILSNEKGPMIYVQRLDSVSPTALRGTEGADIVFWSPDGKDIGFWAEGRLKKIPADGGTALPICDLPSPWSATWNNSGVILASSPRVSSWIVTVKSGTVRPWKFVFWPKFLPDGRHVLYVNNDPKLGGFRCCVEDYVSGRITELMPTNTHVLFVPDQDGREEGHLLFCRSGTLLAQRFDARQVVISGEPAPVAQQVGFFSPTAGSPFDASADGVLIYASGSLKMRLNWVDRRGAELGTITDAVEFRSGLRLSPDNTKVAYDVADLSQGSTDIWVTDLRKGTTERETFEPGVEASAVWSPDSTRLAYGSAQASPPQLRMKTVGDQGSGEAFPPGPFQLPTDWSRDGRWIFYQTSGDDVNAQMWVASVSDRNLTPLLQTPFNNSFPTLSPNNEYLAFAANDTGRSEIYVQRFEGSNQPKLTGPRKRVSHEGGIMPRWRPDGKELFFVSRNRELMATEVRAGIEFGTPVLLFMLRKAIGPLSLGYESYDVSARGDRFLVPKLAASIEPLYVVANWQQALQ